MRASLRRHYRAFLALALTVTASAALAQQFQTPSSRGDLLRKRTYTTTTALNLFVDGALGNDGNSCQGTGTDACATIQAAVDRTPDLIAGAVNITVATGNYAGFVLAGKRIVPPKTASANYLQIRGTLQNATLATGSASGTVTAFTASSGATQAIVTDATQTWTINDLRGKLIEMLTGTGSGVDQLYVIVANTATTVTVAGAGTSGAGTTYAIRDWGTVINTAVPANTGNPLGFANYGAQGIRIESMQSSGNFASGFTITRMSVAMTGTQIYVGVYARMLFLIMKLTDNGVASGSGIQTDVGSQVSFRTGYCKQHASGSCIFMYNVNRASQGLQIQQSLFDGGGSTLQLTGVAAISSSQIMNFGFAALTVGGQGGGCSLQLSSNRIDTGARGIYVANTTAGGGFGQIGLSNVDISNCTTGAIVLDASAAMISAASTSGSGSAVAYLLTQGAHAKIASTAAMTGTVEISLDGTGYSLAAMRALTPKLIATPYGTAAYE